MAEIAPTRYRMVSTTNRVRKVKDLFQVADTNELELFSQLFLSSIQHLSFCFIVVPHTIQNDICRYFRSYVLTYDICGCFYSPQTFITTVFLASYQLFVKKLRPMFRKHIIDCLNCLLPGTTIIISFLNLSHKLVSSSRAIPLIHHFLAGHYIAIT